MSGPNPWGNDPNSPSDDAGKTGSDAPRPAADTPPRNPWTTPDPAREAQPRKAPGKPRLVASNSNPMDDLLARGRSMFGGGGSGHGGGGSGPGRRVWTLGLAALLGIWLLTSVFHIVPPEKEGVVTRLGSYVRTVGPGINLTLPAPLERMELLDVRAINTLTIGGAAKADENFVLTNDQNLIDLAYDVRWSIRDPEQFLFQLENPEGTIGDVAESSMRAAIAGVEFNEAIGTGRGAVEADVQRRMQAVLDAYRAGVTIQGVSIRQTDPPAKVNDAFKDVTAAQQETQSNINDAEAYAQQVLERARGDTAAFDKIYEQYKLSPQVTRQRLYYETMEQVLSNVDKTIVEPNGIAPILNVGSGSRAAPAPTPAPVTKSGGQ